MKKTLRVAALALPLALVAGACGSDKAAEPATTTAAAAPTTAAAPAPTDAPDVTDAPVATDAPDATDAPVATDAAVEVDAAGIAAAEKAIATAAEEPTKIGPTIPLKSKPEPKTVAWLQCELPSCLDITPGFEAATKMLGWKLEVISVQSFDPAPGFQQAIDLGVDYIGLTGTPAALVQDQINAAKEKGIAFFSCFSGDAPDPEANIWMQCADNANVEAVGNLHGNAVIADSKGTAHTLMVNIPDFPVLVAERVGAEKAYKANCPSCTFTELAVTIDQLLAGEIPGAIVAALQEDPSINYIHFAFDGLTGNVSTTLAEAGLADQVKLVGVDFSAAVLQEMVDGTMGFWTANPKPYSGWLMVDGMARHAIGQENTEERTVANFPLWIVRDPAVAKDLIATNGWPGPDTMADQFKTLWGV